MNIMHELLGKAVAVTGKTQYQTVITKGRHSLLADEPESSGGTDTAADPFGLLIASLASCTSITLRMYIDRKMWLVNEITVEVEMFRITGGGALFKRHIALNGELNEAQKKRLEQIADACPVHKILVGDVIVETTMI